jgi:membrane-bound serine protease (ClpP class)
MKIKMRRILFVLCLALGLVGLATGQGRSVYLIEFNDVVHGVSADFVIDGLKKANEAGAEVIIIRMQTPGGMVNSMELMIQAILASKRPVVGYVAPSGSKAASAGFYLLMACDVAVMAPGTRTGAATPVMLTGGGDDENYKTLMEKVKGDSRAFLRTLVSGHRRNPNVPMEETIKWAQDAIDKSEAYTEQECVKYGLTDFTAESVDEILARLDGKRIPRFSLEGSEPRYTEVRTKGAAIVNIEMDFRQQFLSYLSNPMLALLLGTVGVIGLYIEFTNPGLILPGSVGAICLVLASISFQILPVNWAGLLLIGIAIFLFVLEFKIASYGLLTIGGIVCLIIGGLMLFEGPIPELRLSILQVVPFAIAFATISLFLLRLIVKAHRGRVATGTQGLLGKKGVFKGGKVFIHGEIWGVINYEGLSEGDRVEVESIEGLSLRVKKI